MPEKILITSALPYANGPIHFGHIAGAYLPGDCYARFERLRGNDVLYLCGSDEYGIAITLSADLAKRTPKEHVDIFHAINEDFFRKLNFSFDHYSRTTWPGHVETVQQFFLDLYKNGYIEEKVEDHLFSVEENRFLADRYVVGTCPQCGYPEARGDECSKCGASYEATDLKNPRSKLTNTPLQKKPSKHWYLRFDLFKDRLKEWLLQKTDWKPNVLRFAMHYADTLKPRAITRDSSWGIPVPLPEAVGKVLYVWFDAPIGYISAAKELSEKKKDPDLWKKYWLDPNVKLVHFIGKDNIPFHTVFFPAMIMGQNVPYKLPDEVPANEFYLLEGKQFSKSDNWYIDLEGFFVRYTTDQIRYYLATSAPETSDAEFTWKEFQQRCNSDLLGKLGNFVHRTLVFLKNNCDSKVPLVSHMESDDLEFLSDVKQKVEEASFAYSHFQLRKAAAVLMEIAQLGNIYFDKKKPWTLKGDVEKLSAVLYGCLECIKCLALVASPIIPSTAESIWKLLGYKTSVEKGLWKSIIETPIPPGQVIEEPKVLFRKIEDAEIVLEMEKLQKKETKEDPRISFDEFSKVDLRVATILHVEAVPKSKKLYRIEVELGSEKRQIVSGIAEAFSPQDLIGKKVVMVANLAPAKLMGIESQGMILAVGDGKELELLCVNKSPSGSKVS
ncbi:MAG: methionine--tRNA ligase [Chlamydiota bacterium]